MSGRRRSGWVCFACRVHFLTFVDNPSCTRHRYSRAELVHPETRDGSSDLASPPSFDWSRGDELAHTTCALPSLALLLSPSLTRPMSPSPLSTLPSASDEVSAPPTAAAGDVQALKDDATSLSDQHPRVSDPAGDEADLETAASTVCDEPDHGGQDGGLALDVEHVPVNDDPRQWPRARKTAVLACVSLLAFVRRTNPLILVHRAGLSHSPPWAVQSRHPSSSPPWDLYSKS